MTGWTTWLVRGGIAAAAVLLLVLLRWLIVPVFAGQPRVETPEASVAVGEQAGDADQTPRPRRPMQQVVLRMSLAAMASFLIVVLGGPRMIRFLIRRKLGDRPEFAHADLNQLTRHKSATPTMGGILIVVAIFVATYLFADMSSFYVRMSLMALVWLGILGGVDDWTKLQAGRPQTGTDAKPSRLGLRSWQKLLFQIALAVLLAVFTYQHGSASTYPFADMGRINAPHYLFLPFKTAPIAMGIAAYVVITVLVMVGSSNAVNLTDGMDGLASGCMIITTGVLLLVAMVVGTPLWAANVELPHIPEAAELSIVCAAIIGACMGFLWYNCLPAQVFMGDTGSLPLGGLIGYIAIVTRQESLLLISGGVFVMEAVSVILQVGYFKATKGKRIFRCAPIHYHFHLGGWAESKVVVRFWLLSALLAALALATLKMG